MKYFISDLHLFHENAIKYDHRPFDSIQEMHEVIMMIYLIIDISSYLLKSAIIKKFKI